MFAFQYVDCLCYIVYNEKDFHHFREKGIIRRNSMPWNSIYLDNRKQIILGRSPTSSS